MILVRFEVTIPPERQNPNLAQELHGELPGIFLWALEGLRRLRKQGRFTIPADSVEALLDYRRENNPARLFLEDCCEERLGTLILSGELYQDYLGWAKENKFEALNESQFGKELRKVFPNAKRERKSISGKRPWAYVGLSRVPDRPMLSTTDELAMDVVDVENYQEGDGVGVTGLLGQHGKQPH
jgi:putative DNA primase/helicase